MANRRHGAGQRLGTFFVIVLLLAPLLWRGHTHANDQRSADSCAICVAAHHSPSLSTTLAPPIAPLLQWFAVAPAAIGAPVQLRAASHRGRSPPSFAVLYVA